MIGSFYRSSFQTSHNLKCPGHCGYCILTVRYIGYTSMFSWQWILKLVFWDVTPYSLVGRYVSTFREMYIPDYMVSYQNTVVFPCIFTSQPLPLIASINAFWKLKQLFNPMPNLYASTPLLSALMPAFVRTSCMKYCTFRCTHNSGQALKSLFHTEHCNSNATSWQIQPLHALKLPHSMKNSQKNYVSTHITL